MRPIYHFYIARTVLYIFGNNKVRQFCFLMLLLIIKVQINKLEVNINKYIICDKQFKCNMIANMKKAMITDFNQG